MFVFALVMQNFYAFIYMQKYTGSNREIDKVYKAWKDKLKTFYFWAAVKNYRWSINPVSLRGGVRPP